MNTSYLVVTHIPFARTRWGALVDSLWARDLEGLVSATGPVRVVAPELPASSKVAAWGPSAVELKPDSGVSFAGFPPVGSRKQFWKWPEIRAILRREVENADTVHSSHLFEPYLGLSYAHDLAVKLGKRTVFVVAEDFHDVQTWEWVRAAGSGWTRLRRQRTLDAIDARVRKTASTASLTFLHTPAAVERYRLHTRRHMTIRQPGHEESDVIAWPVLEARLRSLQSGRPLHVATACRHVELKGLDLLLRALHLARSQGTRVCATLYGQGPATPQLEALARSLGMDREIRFPGPLPPGAAVYEALGQADLFAMPHRTTDFGRAFFDAMAAAAPVIAFRTSASSDTVQDGSDGFLTPLDDVQALAERLCQLDAQRDRLAEAARNARTRALRNTRSMWFRLRAEWTRSVHREVA